MAEDLEKNKRMNTELARHLDFKYYSTRHAGFGGKLGDPGFHLADAQCPRHAYRETLRTVECALRRD